MKAFTLIVCYACLSICAPAWSGQAAPVFEALDGEASRADLFQRIVAAELAGQPERAKESTTFFNLNGPFVFPNDTTFDAVEKKPRAPAIFGIDISHYTDSAIPLEDLWKHKVTFVYAKVSQGVTGKDAKFAEFWKRLGKLQKGHEVHRGAYHFLSSSTDAIAQANTFLTLLEQNGGLAATDMPPVLDLEWDSRRTDPTDQWKNHTADQILDKTMKWLEHVQKKTGRAPLVYTNSVWWRERIGSEQKFAALKGFPIWIADYSTSARAVEVPRVPNKTPWALWQFTDGALVGTTFKNGLDANIFKGSKKDFHAAFKVSPF